MNSSHQMTFPGRKVGAVSRGHGTHMVPLWSGQVELAVLHPGHESLPLVWGKAQYRTAGVLGVPQEYLGDYESNFYAIRVSGPGIGALPECRDWRAQLFHLFVLSLPTVRCRRWKPRSASELGGFMTGKLSPDLGENLVAGLYDARGDL